MYEKVQKRSSEWSATSAQKPSQSQYGPSSFSVQRESNKKSNPLPEKREYSSAGRDAFAAKILRTLAAKELREEATPKQIADLAMNRDAPATTDAETIQQQQDSSSGKVMLPIQAKLTIGEPGDKYEQEADRVAEQVMSMPDAKPSVQREGMPEEEEELQTKQLAATITPLVQREAVPEEELQTKRSPDAGFQAGNNLESRLNSSQGGGSPLPDEVRSFMEPRFGADFSQVRVHTGSESVQMNQDLNAQAFTHKQDVYFGSGKSPAKDVLTAHELTHVVQQTGKLQKKSNSGIPTIQLNCSVCEGEKEVNRMNITACKRINAVQQTDGVQINRISDKTLVQMQSKGGESKICNERPKFTDTSPVPVDILADSFSDFMSQMVPKLGSSPHMQPNYEWNFETDEKGRVTAVNMVLNTTILRPRWSGGRPTEMDRALIDKTVELVKLHEEAHRNIQREGLEAVVCTLIGKTPTVAEKLLKAAIKKRCLAQENFDSTHGTVKGIKGSDGNFVNVEITNLPKKPNYDCG